MKKIIKNDLTAYLDSNDFKIHSRYETNIKYVKEIGSVGNLFVRTLNSKLKEVSYEQIPQTKFESSAVAILHSVNTVEKLIKLLDAFLEKE